MSSCSLLSCAADSRNVKRFYDIKEMLSVTLNVISYSNVTQYNNVTQYDDTKKISHNNLLIGLQVSKRELYAFNENINTGNSSLMACSPIRAGSDGSKEIIKSIKITSNSAFSTELPSGADLSKKFSFYGYSVGDEDIESFPNLAMIKSTDDFNYYAYDYTTTPLEDINNPNTTNINKKAKAVCALRLNEAPITSKSHIFTIEYEHQDGEKFTFVTQNISFL